MQAAAKEQQAVPPVWCNGVWKGGEGQPQSLTPRVYLLHVAVRRHGPQRCWISELVIRRHFGAVCTGKCTWQGIRSTSDSAR